MFPACKLSRKLFLESLKWSYNFSGGSAHCALKQMLPMTSYDCLHSSSITERRFRNRSLSNLLWTPPLYPGYSAAAKFGKSSKVDDLYQQSEKSDRADLATSSSSSSSLSNPLLLNSTNFNYHSSSTQNIIINTTCSFKVV